MRALIALLLMVSFASTHATEHFSLTPSINYFTFDDQANIDDDQGYGLAFGYRFTEGYKLELNYTFNDAKIDTSLLDVVYESLSIDNVFYFNESNGNSYLRMGLGEVKTNPDVGLQKDDTLLKLGFGWTKPMNKSTDMMLEFQTNYGLNESELNYGLVFSLNYRFGQSQARNYGASRIPVQNYPDRDGDGVPDHKDACDEIVPEGKEVNSVGCVIGYR